MTLALSTAVKQARSTAVKTTIDAGTDVGKIKLYASPRPDAGAAPTSALLATILLSDPCGTVDASGLHLTSPVPAQSGAAGIVSWARVTDSDDNYIMDGDVRMAADVDAEIADFLIDIAQVYPGSFVTLVSATLAEGG